MRKLKITLEYDGTDFFGWQSQPDRRTVQGELLHALRVLTGGDVKVVGAGRTDAGVHAAGQVASADLETRLAPEAIQKALNAKLPSDIVVRQVEEASPFFNARFDAKSRTYHYIFIRRRTALWKRYFYLTACGLDLRAMRRALREIIGEKDFTSFASTADTCGAKRCNVIRAELIDSPPLLVLAVTADHFLHNMVRTLAGTTLEIGKGKPWSMTGIIDARNRSNSGPTLPPHALYLMEVKY
jgi:tRNA pseudouridine38-40 synthase